VYVSARYDGPLGKGAAGSEPFLVEKGKTYKKDLKVVFNVVE